MWYDIFKGTVCKAISIQVSFTLFSQRTITESRWSSTYICLAGVSQKLLKVRKKMMKKSHVPPCSSHRNSVFKSSVQQSKVLIDSQIRIFCGCSQKSSKTVVKPFATLRRDPVSRSLALLLHNKVMYKELTTCAVFRSRFSFQLKILLGASHLIFPKASGNLKAKCCHTVTSAATGRTFQNLLLASKRSNGET